MASGRQIAEENIRRLRQWADEPRRPEDWGTFIKNGQLNRSAVASACGFGRSVFLQNPAAKAFVADLENRLADSGVLRPRVGRDEGVDDRSAPNHQAQPVTTDEKVRRLEQEVKRRDERIAAMLAEITGLRDRIKRLEHVEMAMQSGRRVVP